MYRAKAGICRGFEVRCGVAQLLLMCGASTALPLLASPAQDAPLVTLTAKPFVGHYYLSGIREVGSELVLRADGTYDWFLAYGAVDQFSKGHWKLARAQISLIADVPEHKGPLFTPEPLRPWDEEAEQKVQDALRDAAVDAIYRHCPFMLDEGGISAASTMPALPSRTATPSDLAAVELAKGIELEDRREYEAAAVQAMTGKAQDKKLHASARAARMLWTQSSFELRIAKNAAGLPMTDDIDAKLPAECTIPQYGKRSVDLPPAQWTRGFGVKIYDPEIGQNFSGIIATFHYSDGTTVKRASDRGGDAWAPLREGVTVNMLDLEVALDGGLSKESFNFAAVREGVLPIIFHSQAVTSTAFDVMKLEIEGADLIAFEGRGRYHRAR